MFNDVQSTVNIYNDSINTTTEPKNNNLRIDQNQNVLKENLRIMYLNIQSITNKINSIEHIIEQKDIHILCLSEHWMNSENFNCYNLTEHKLVSIFYRTTYKHGGVAIFCKNNMSAVNIPEITNLSIEITCEITAVYIENIKLIILTIYRTGDNLEKFIDIIEQALDYIVTYYPANTGIILAGDFNVNLMSSSIDKKKDIIINAMKLFNLHKTINDVTRYGNNSSTCIDNIFTNLIKYTATTYPAAISDHEAIILETQISLKLKSANNVYKRRVYKDHSVNNLLSDLIDENYQNVFEENDVNIKFNNFLATFMLYCNANLPFKRVHQSRKYKQPTDELQRLKETVDFAYHIYKQNRNENEFKTIYDNLKNNYNKACEREKQDNNTKEILVSENKTKTIWNIINKETGRSKKQINELLKGDEFNQYFCNITNSTTNKISNPPYTTDKYLKNVPVNGKTFFLKPTTEQEIEIIIKKLKPKRTQDIYGLDTIIIKKVASAILSPLCNIINACFCQGIFPDRMKTARVVPVHKKGDEKVMNNYRPISILPVFSKILEKLIGIRILNFLNENKYFTKAQYGFREQRSTVDAINDLVHFITDSFEEQEHCCAHLIDLSKAFDCMCPHIMLEKLEYYGIRGVGYKLIQSYFQNRLQLVDINGKTSSTQKLQRGAPQGSILGPLLFIIFVNDLPTNTTGHTILYADDTTICVRDKNAENLRVKIQAASKEASNWIKTNKLIQNNEKTCMIHFTSSKRHPELHGGTVRFLGVQLDSLLTWEPQIANLSKTLTSCIYAIKRISITANLAAVKATYHSLFHSKMIYGIATWGNSAHAKKIFTLQKKAIRSIVKLSSESHCKPYFQSLGILTLPGAYLFEVIKQTRKKIHDLPRRGDIHNYTTRQRQDLDIPSYRLQLTSARHTGERAYNKLPEEIKNKSNQALKQYLIKMAPYKVEEYFSTNNCT